MQINGNIVVLPVPAEKQDLTYLPDRFETGERVQTPRGSFQVTAMSREQMEAAGYGVHHISDDGKYIRKADFLKEDLHAYDNDISYGDI